MQVDNGAPQKIMPLLMVLLADCAVLDPLSECLRPNNTGSEHGSTGSQCANNKVSDV